MAKTKKDAEYYRTQFPAEAVAKGVELLQRPAPDVTAFAVVEVSPGMFQPMRITLTAVSAFSAQPLHEATNYEAVAYEYLQGDVGFHFDGIQLERAK